MVRTLIWGMALLLLGCSKEVIPTDAEAYAPSQLRLQVGDSALVFFAAATKDDYYRDSVFPAVLETAWPGGALHFDDAEVNLHGESSLLLPRKSFEVKMPYRVAPLGGDVALKKFFLIAMEQDTGYFRNALAFGLLSRFHGLFLGYFQYTRLELNGVDQGLYLLVERPQDAIERRVPGAMVFRRNYDQIWFAKGAVKEDSVLLGIYEEDARRLGFMPLLYEGQELLDSLDAHLDLEQYLAWLAFNRLVRNGDYLDEVFYYRTAQDKRWHVMGWDYEDIFQPPHGGRFTEGSWVYNNEYPLDSAIEKTPLLLSLYGQALRAMAEELDSASLEAAWSQVRSEVLPWFSDTAIARINGNFGAAPAQAQAVLERELYRREKEMLSTRDTLLRAP